VVEHVLLELVEQQVQLASRLRRGRDRVDQAGGRPEVAALGAHGGDQPGGGILRPRVVDDDRRVAQLP
jgi:hypothetical protein